MVLVKSVVAQDFDVVRRLFHCCDSIIWAFWFDWNRRPWDWLTCVYFWVHGIIVT
jgi:hypothetical protein